jgi:hypothetical protein
MWILVVFYVSTTGDIQLDTFVTKGRDNCRDLEAQAVQMMLKDPLIGIKHKTLCKKLDVA